MCIQSFAFNFAYVIIISNLPQFNERFVKPQETVLLLRLCCIILFFPWNLGPGPSLSLVLSQEKKCSRQKEGFLT